jgi:hypothetical protein
LSHKDILFGSEIIYCVAVHFKFSRHKIIPNGLPWNQVIFFAVVQKNEQEEP